MKSSALSRRELLRLAATVGGYTAAATPLTMLIESIMAGLVNKAYGANPDKKYLLCQLEGAPSRWGSDLFLNPYNETAFTPNLNIVNKFVLTAGRYTQAEYATVKRTDYLGRPINVPWLWQFNVPKVGGALRPMDEILKHMILVRGLDIGQGQHQAAMALHMHPLGATQSMTAVAADNGSQTYVPGINLGAAEYRFISTKGYTSVNVPNGGDMVRALMTPFTSAATATYKTNKAAIKNTIDAAHVALENMALKSDIKAQALADNRKSAQLLLENGIANMTSYWAPAVAKYKDLITRCLGPSRAPVPGIDDYPIGDTNVAARGALYMVTAKVCDQVDMRSTITTRTAIDTMAEHFAFSEFVLLNNISNSIVMRPGYIRSILFANNVTHYVNFDEHDHGFYATVFYNAIYNRALYACLLELIDRLQAGNVFKDTVIDISPEFGRITRADGTGSDHGSRGGSNCLITGANSSGPVIIGNIVNKYSDSNPNNYTGTWGCGAIHKGLNQVLNLGHLASTTAHLLDAPSPVTAAPSLLKKTNTGSFVPAIDEIPDQV